MIFIKLIKLMRFYAIYIGEVCIFVIIGFNWCSLYEEIQEVDLF
jgi:hypothetical protein